MKRLFLTFAAVCVGLLGISGWLHHRHLLGAAPQGLGVSRVLYSSERRWGFGPGGNATGVVVYGLDESAAEAVQAGGSQFLSSLGDQRFSGWTPTPLRSSERWVHQTGAGEAYRSGHVPSITDFLDRLGFSIPVPKKIREQFDASLFAPGSYFAKGKVSLVVVSPRARRVFLAYAG